MYYIEFHLPDLNNVINGWKSEYTKSYSHNNTIKHNHYNQS